MAILEFFISLVFIFLLISLFVSWIIDFWASRLNRKGRFLQKMLKKLLGEDELVNWSSRLYKHPLIESLSYINSRLTSLIPAEMFANAIADMIVEEGRNYHFKQNPDTKKVEYHEDPSLGFMKDIGEGLKKIPESDLKRTVKLLYEKAGDDEKNFLSGLESWYNEYMVRVNHTYKRLLRLPLWVMGIIIAVLFNIDALRLTNELWVDANLRGEVAQAAMEFSKQYESIDSVKVSQEFFEDYRESLKLPVGWKYESKAIDKLRKEDNTPVDFGYVSLKIIGFLLTGMIASFGAPFWYDALQKIVGLKKSVKIKTE